ADYPIFQHWPVTGNPLPPPSDTPVSREWAEHLLPENAVVSLRDDRSAPDLLSGRGAVLPARRNLRCFPSGGFALAHSLQPHGLAEHPAPCPAPGRSAGVHPGVAYSQAVALHRDRYPARGGDVQLHEFSRDSPGPDFLGLGQAAIPGEGADDLEGSRTHGGNLSGAHDAADSGVGVRPSGLPGEGSLRDWADPRCLDSRKRPGLFRDAGLLSRPLRRDAVTLVLRRRREPGLCGGGPN